MQYQYTVHQKDKVYDGFFKFNRYDVSFERFGGGFIEHVSRECGRKGDVVAVLAFDPVREVFLMVEQFRIGMVVRNQHPWTQEIVAGFMDKPGESPIQTAERELQEETGCQAKAMHHLFSFHPSPGGSASRVHLFIAEVDSSEVTEITGITEEGEDIFVHRVPLADIRERLRKGELDSATTLVAYQQFFLDNWQQQLQSANLSTS